MGKNRFVSTDTVRLDLSEGDWIEIKKELSVAERKRLEGSPMSGAHQDKENPDPNAVEMTMAWDRFFLLKLRLYIVDWSLVDGSGKRVKLSPEAISNLTDEDAEEVMAAINKHEEGLAEERKNRTGQFSVVKTS